MSKRFTDTNKWAKANFQSLKPKLKLAWIYLCDNCDHAGVWDINFPLMSFQIGESITAQELLHSFSDSIEIREDKVFVQAFIDFQYGSLNPDNRVHQSVISRLEKFQNKPLTSPLQGAKDKDKEKDKDKDKEQDKEKENEISNFENWKSLFEIYNAHCGSLPKAKSWNKLREASAKARWKELPETDSWIKVVQYFANSSHHTGNNDRGWVASFDFILQQGRWTQAIEKVDTQGAPKTFNRSEQRTEANRAVAKAYAAKLKEESNEG